MHSYQRSGDPTPKNHDETGTESMGETVGGGDDNNRGAKPKHGSNAAKRLGARFRDLGYPGVAKAPPAQTPMRAIDWALSAVRPAQPGNAACTNPPKEIDEEAERLWRENWLAGCRSRELEAKPEAMEFETLRGASLGHDLVARLKALARSTSAPLTLVVIGALPASGLCRRRRGARAARPAPARPGAARTDRQRWKVSNRPPLHPPVGDVVASYPLAPCAPRPAIRPPTSRAGTGCEPTGWRTAEPRTGHPHDV